MFWNSNHLDSSIKLKQRDKLGGQKTNNRYHSVSVGNQSIHLMNEKVVSATWVDRSRGIMEITYDPNEDGKYVKAMHLGPDKYVTLPAGMSAADAANASNYQHEINKGIQSRGGNTANNRDDDDDDENDNNSKGKSKEKGKGFFGLKFWSIENLLVSIVMVPLWLIWKVFILGIVAMIVGGSDKD